MKFGASLPGENFDPFDLENIQGWEIITRNKTRYTVSSDGRLFRNSRDRGKVQLIAAVKPGQAVALSEKFRKKQIKLGEVISALRQHGHFPREGLCLVALTILRGDDGMHFRRRISSPIISVKKARKDDRV